MSASDRRQWGKQQGIFPSHKQVDKEMRREKANLRQAAVPYCPHPISYALVSGTEFSNGRTCPLKQVCNFHSFIVWSMREPQFIHALPVIYFVRMIDVATKTKTTKHISLLSKNIMMEKRKSSLKERICFIKSSERTNRQSTTIG